MKLGVVIRKNDPISLCASREHVLARLPQWGVDIVHLGEKTKKLPMCDILWEPGLAGNRAPNRVFKEKGPAVVATVHGAAPLVLHWHDYYPTLFAAIQDWGANRRALARWNWFRSRVAAIIAVSEYGAREIAATYKIEKQKIVSVYHGVDNKVFRKTGESPGAVSPYLLCIAQYQPKKNIDRVFQAYAHVPQKARPDLIAILPGYRGNQLNLKGLKLIREPMSPLELARLYCGAIGLVFPSLHETFGLPILEAMACGCPVITSNVTACPEVAAGAAILVDPRSVDQIAEAMVQVTADSELRRQLREKGLARAKEFTWEKSARQHLEVFETVLSGARG